MLDSSRFLSEVVDCISSREFSEILTCIMCQLDLQHAHATQEADMGRIPLVTGLQCDRDHVIRTLFNPRGPMLCAFVISDAGVALEQAPQTKRLSCADLASALSIYLMALHPRDGPTALAAGYLFVPRVVLVQENGALVACPLRSLEHHLAGALPPRSITRAWLSFTTETGNAALQHTVLEQRSEWERMPLVWQRSLRAICHGSAALQHIYREQGLVLSVADLKAFVSTDSQGYLLLTNPAWVRGTASDQRGFVCLADAYRQLLVCVGHLWRQSAGPDIRPFFFLPCLQELHTSLKRVPIPGSRPWDEAVASFISELRSLLTWIETKFLSEFKEQTAQLLAEIGRPWLSLTVIARPVQQSTSSGSGQSSVVSGSSLISPSSSGGASSGGCSAVTQDLYSTNLRTPPAVAAPMNPPPVPANRPRTWNRNRNPDPYLAPPATAAGDTHSGIPRNSWPTPATLAAIAAIAPLVPTARPYANHEEVDTAKPISCGQDQTVTNEEIDTALLAQPLNLARLAATPEDTTFGFSSDVVTRAKVLAEAAKVLAKVLAEAANVAAAATTLRPSRYLTRQQSMVPAMVEAIERYVADKGVRYVNMLQVMAKLNHKTSVELVSHVQLLSVGLHYLSSVYSGAVEILICCGNVQSVPNNGNTAPDSVVTSLCTLLAGGSLWGLNVGEWQFSPAQMEALCKAAAGPTSRLCFAFVDSVLCGSEKTLDLRVNVLRPRRRATVDATWLLGEDLEWNKILTNPGNFNFWLNPGSLRRNKERLQQMRKRPMGCRLWPPVPAGTPVQPPAAATSVLDPGDVVHFLERLASAMSGDANESWVLRVNELVRNGQVTGKENQLIKLDHCIFIGFTTSDESPAGILVANINHRLSKVSVCIMRPLFVLQSHRGHTGYKLFACLAAKLVALHPTCEITFTLEAVHCVLEFSHYWDKVFAKYCEEVWQYHGAWQQSKAVGLDETEPPLMLTIGPPPLELLIDCGSEQSIVRSGPDAGGVFAEVSWKPWDPVEKAAFVYALRIGDLQSSDKPPAFVPHGGFWPDASRAGVYVTYMLVKSAWVPFTLVTDHPRLPPGAVGMWPLYGAKQPCFRSHGIPIASFEGAAPAKSVTGEYTLQLGKGGRARFYDASNLRKGSAASINSVGGICGTLTAAYVWQSNLHVYAVPLVPGMAVPGRRSLKVLSDATCIRDLRESEILIEYDWEAMKDANPVARPVISKVKENSLGQLGFSSWECWFLLGHWSALPARLTSANSNPTKLERLFIDDMNTIWRNSLCLERVHEGSAGCHGLRVNSAISGKFSIYGGEVLTRDDLPTRQSHIWSVISGYYIDGKAASTMPQAFWLPLANSSLGADNVGSVCRYNAKVSKLRVPNKPDCAEDILMCASTLPIKNEDGELTGKFETLPAGTFIRLEYDWGEIVEEHSSRGRVR